MSTEEDDLLGESDDNMGHNGGPSMKTKGRTVGTTADRLSSFVQRIERLEEDKKGIADDIKEVYAEAKGEGFDAKILRRVVALRKKDPEERAEEEELLELYMSALGMAFSSEE